MVLRVRLHPPWKQFLRVTAGLLVLLGVAGLLVWLWGLSDGFVYQYTQRAQFSTDAPSAGARVAGNPTLPAATAHSGVSRWLASALPQRDPLLLGRLEIASIHLDVMLREGVDETSLRKAAGHLPSSALPGEIGNVVLLGHRDTFFRSLRGITQGDSIGVRTRTGSFDYVVESIQVVAPEQSLAFERDPSAKSITLITCFPFDYVGPAPRRFVVRARMLPKTMLSEVDPALHSVSAESPSLERVR